MSVTNPHSANDALDRLKESGSGDAGGLNDDEIEEIQDELETHTDVGDEAEAKPDGGVKVYQMTDDRRVGTVSMTVDDENLRFGKPNVYAGRELDSQLESFDDENQSAGFYDWVLGTCAEWAINPQYDEEWFGRNCGLIDCIQIVRNLTLGGNPQVR